jgi:hypothetical protein
VQLWPPVEVIRIVVAATAPVESAVPAAVTQSPTARLEDAAAWVSLKVVDDASFTLNVVVFNLGSVVVVVDLLLLELFFEVVVVVDLDVDFVVAAVEMPEMVKVVELTAVTLPLPTAMLPSRPAKLRAPFPPPAPLPPLLEPVLPDAPVPPGGRKPAPPGKVPVPPPWPAPPKPVDPRPAVVQLDPSGWLTATDRAVMVPLEDVPVTVTQSPVEMADAVTVVVCENAVDGVQLTVV